MNRGSGGRMDDSAVVSGIGGRGGAVATVGGVARMNTKKRIMNYTDLEAGQERRLDFSSTTTTHIATETQQKNIVCRCLDCVLWYILLMPIWCSIAVYGNDKLKKHREDEALKSPMPYPLGKVVHHKPRTQYGNLIGPRKVGGGSGFERKNGPNDDDSDSDEHERKPLMRTTSFPEVKKAGRDGRKNNISSALDSKLPPLPKRKVGFSLGSKHNVLHEKKPLDRSRPMTPDSFSSASFEVIRSDSYGATTEGLSIIDQVKLMDSSHHDGDSGNEDDGHLSELDSDDDHDDGLTFTSDAHSQDSSIFIGDNSPTKMNECDESQTSSIGAPTPPKQKARKIKQSIHKARHSSNKSSSTANAATARSEEAKSMNHPQEMKQLSDKGRINLGGTIIVVKDEVEDDPQDDSPSAIDFAVAIFYVVFGVVALSAGLLSAFMKK